ncbi:MAG: hypothetical protein A2542_00560 [Parcubacteria group bacterium RIFOXYD2_FULL_52_8]|nr:MAG: hypothetical protein A2542_00560 [Parcubacteria group bacterium RIFOXYD2_FULL_52_8]
MSPLFLAQLFGVYLVIEGLVLLFRQAFVRREISALMHNEGLRLFAGFLILIMGLVLVLTHNVWEWSYEGVITLVSWIVVLKSCMYLFFDQKTLNRVTRWFDTKGWYRFAGIVALLLGLYLSSVGFGWML